MTIRSLEIFECVARHGKMSQAADELYIAQPTISKAVSELEKEYGVQLFDRLNKKLYITKEGEQLLVYAQQLLSLVGEMKKNMVNLSVHKTILLGATMTVGKCVLVDIINSFEEEHLNTQIQVTIDNTTVIEKLLLSSKLDIALVEGDIQSTDLKVMSAISDHLVLLCSTKHPLAHREVVRLDELASYPFILREEGSGTRELFMNELRKNKIQIYIKWSCHGFDSLLEAVLANQGITVISERIAKEYILENKLCLVPVKGLPLNRSFSLVHHKTKHLGRALEDLIELILSRQNK